MDDNTDLGLVATTLFPEEWSEAGPTAAFALAERIRDSLESETDTYSDEQLMNDLKELSRLLGETKAYIDAVTGERDT